MLKFNEPKFEDIKTSDFGGEVTIRVNAETVKYYTRKLRLYTKADEMKLPDEDTVDHKIAAGLMAICTDPETGDSFFQDEDLEQFTRCVSGKLFGQLTSASFNVNDRENIDDGSENETLNTKKNDI